MDEDNVSGKIARPSVETGLAVEIEVRYNLIGNFLVGKPAISNLIKSIPILGEKNHE